MTSHPAHDNTLRILSWNVLRGMGATRDDVFRLATMTKADIICLQETEPNNTRRLTADYWIFHAPFINRKQGVALCLSRSRFPEEPAFQSIDLAWEGRNRPHRRAAIAHTDLIGVASIHLSHDQIFNRYQIRQTRQRLTAQRQASYPCAICGDTNALGPTPARGFKDNGPKSQTHLMLGLIGVRIDRFLTRNLRVTQRTAYEPGPSDHRPILIEAAC